MKDAPENNPRPLIRHIWPKDAAKLDPRWRIKWSNGTCVPHKKEEKE